MKTSNTSAETVAQTFVSMWISRFGVPSTITTDQGSQFESLLWHKLMQLSGSKRIETTAYYPIANDIVERFHHQLKGALKASTDLTIGLTCCYWAYVPVLRKTLEAV